MIIHRIRSFNMYNLYIDNTHKTYITRLLKYIYFEYKDTFKRVTLNNIIIQDDNECHLQYSLKLDKNQAIHISYENEDVYIQNESTDCIELGCDNVYHTDITIKISSKHLHTIENLLKTSSKHDNTLHERLSSEKDIDVLKYDYGWCMCYRTKKRTFDTIYLNKNTKEALMTDIKKFNEIEIKNRYKQLSLTHTRTYLFHGPPGTGKTSVIRAIATEFNISLAILNFTKEMDDDSLQHALKRLPKNTALIIEDVDCLFSKRKQHDDINHSVTFSGFLNSLDGVIQNDDTMIFITTNHIEELDQALKRRIDYFVEFDYTSKEQVEKMFYDFYPHLKDKFETFYSEIKSTRFTVNMLQKFFSKYLFEDVTLRSNEFNNFKSIIDTKPNNMYT